MLVPPPVEPDPGFASTALRPFPRSAVPAPSLAGCGRTIPFEADAHPLTGAGDAHVGPDPPGSGPTIGLPFADLLLAFDHHEGVGILDPSSANADTAVASMLPS